MLTLLTHITNTRKMFELTLGQGHKVKGQGQICVNVKKLVLTIYHEPMIGY